MKSYFLAAIYLCSIVLLSYGIDRTQFVPLITLYSIAFVAYGYLCTKELPYFPQLGIALFFIVRILLLFQVPNLSDDFYRFIWDGRLWCNQINPFLQLPQYWIQQTELPQGIEESLYQKLNSPSYHTVYPPVNQLIFFLSTYLFPHSIHGSVIVMKLCLLTIEGLGAYYLYRLLIDSYPLIGRARLASFLARRSGCSWVRFRSAASGSSPKGCSTTIPHAYSAVFLYTLNPLTVVEISGNIHFEGAMISFLIIAFYCLFQKKIYLSAFFYALSIASKLLPLMFLPLLLKKNDFNTNFRYLISIGLFCLVLFAPLYDDAVLQNFLSSIELYFRKFEFNASIYYLLRALGYWYKGFNLIHILGPLLLFLNIVVISGMSIFSKQTIQNPVSSFVYEAFIMYSIYLILSTTVHPWYVLMVLALGILSGSYVYPILWSYLVFFTYINYSYQPYYENLYLVLLEYAIVIPVAFYEYNNFKTYEKEKL